MTFIKKNWLSLLTLALTTSILIITMVQLSSDGVLGIFSALKTLDPLWVCAAFLAIIVYWLMDTLSLHILTLVRERTYRFANSFVTAMLCLLYSAITPFATGGQPFAIYEMKKTGVKTGVATSIIMVKSLIYQFGMVAYALICCVYAWNALSGQVVGFRWYIFFGAVCNVLFILAILVFSFSRKLIYHVVAGFVAALHKLRIIKDKERARKNAFAQLRLYRQSMLSATKNVRVTLVCLLITFVQLSAYFAIPFFIYAAFGLSGNSVFFIISTNAIITMITAFMPLPGGSGAAEGGFYLFFKSCFTPETILPAILLWRAASYYSCIVAGVFISATRTLSKRTKKTS